VEDARIRHALAALLVAAERLAAAIQFLTLERKGDSKGETAV
jgi:hypothetical protein